MTGVLVVRGKDTERHTEEKTCEGRGGGCSDAATSQRTPAGRDKEAVFPRAFRKSMALLTP